MFFKDANHTNASHSIFNDVGNQVNVYGPITIYYSSTPSAKSSCFPCKSSSNQTWPILNPEVLSTRSLIAICHSSVQVTVIIDATLGDVAAITQLLISRRVPSDSHLVPELKLLQHILILNKLAIEAYGDRFLGQCLANGITPAVERCRVVLQELLDRVGSTWLNFVHIGDLWGSTWWNKWDENELALLKRKLCYVRSPLGEMLLALDSVSWVELGSEWCSIHASLKTFHTLLSKRLPSLGHIQLNSVQVVDHLGRIVPVPIQFCSTWKEFNYIIKGHCRNLPGSRFVEQGDYEVMRTADSQIIRQSEFAVETGMVLEMAIVLRHLAANQDNKCPRCGHLNLNATVHNGWIECIGCPAQFQVITVDKKNEKNEETNSAEDRGEVRHEGVIDDEHWSEENDTHRDPEIISPASQSKKDTANKDSSQPQNDDGKQFFRRIQVLYENNIPGATPAVNRLDGEVKRIFVLNVTGRTPPDNILQQSEGKRSLNIFVTTALLLPISSEDTAKQFSLEEPIKEKLRGQIDSSTIINQRLQEHCQDFQDTAFKKLRDLIRDIKNYARDAQISLPAIKSNLEQLVRVGKAGATRETGDLELVERWARLNKSKSEAILDVAEVVSARLQYFANQITIDAGNVSREMKYLSHQSTKIGQGTNSRLTSAVETLKRLAASTDQSVTTLSASKEEPQWEWIPLVGLVPRQIIEEPDGKIHFDYISKLSESRDERILQERASLTCIMMKSYWERIHELLEPANKTVQQIQGLLEIVRVDLELIDNCISDLLEFPLQSDITSWELGWEDLNKHADDLWNSAYIGNNKTL